MKSINLLKYYIVIGTILFTASCEKDDSNDDNNNHLGSKKLIATVFESSHDSTVFVYNTEGLLSEVEYYDGSYNYSTNKYTYEPDNRNMSFVYKNGLLTVKKYDAIVSMEECNDIDSIFYDSQNRIEKMVQYRFVEGSLSTKPDTLLFLYDEASQLSKIIHSKYYTEEFLYDDEGNVIRINDIGTTGINDSTFYSFDKKPNPYKNNPFQLLEYEFLNIHNVVEKTNSLSSSTTYTYQYDKDGYPIIRSYYYRGNQFVTRFHYE